MERAAAAAGAPLHASLRVAPPSWVAIAALRLLLVRVMVGMGKFKFSRVDAPRQPRLPEVVPRLAAADAARAPARP